MKTPSAASKPRSLRRRSPRGQAMIEYSLVTHFLLLGGALALMPVMARLYDALSEFFDSIYFVLTTGAI